MKKPSVLFLNVYDTYALGPRYIAAMIRKHNIPCYFLNFKVFITKTCSVGEYRKFYPKMREKYEYVMTQHFMKQKCFLPTDNPYTQKEIDLTMQYIQEINPSHICFSVQSSNEKICEMLTREIRKISPETTIVWGGVCPTYDPGEALKHADIVCRGEGEYALLELLQNPNDQTIPNLAFPGENGKDNIINPVRPLKVELDELPFPEYGTNELFVDYDNIQPLFDMHPQMRNDHIYVQTSRGCAYQCSYCHNSMMKKKIYPNDPVFRKRSVQNVIDQVRFYQEKYQIEYVLFTDEIFIKDEPWIEEFAEAYKEIGLPFTGYCHPCMTSRRMLELLRDAGMKIVTMGVQSGSDRVLKDIYHRYFGSQPLYEMVTLFNDLQFDMVRYDLIVHSPYDDWEDYEQTLKFLLTVDHPFELAIFSLEYFPFSELYEMERKPYTVTEQQRESWIALYLMTTIRGFPHSWLCFFSRSKWLMNHPHILRIFGFLFRNDEELPGYFEPFKGYHFSLSSVFSNLSYVAKSRWKQLKGYLS